jgi:hypothetical protein
MTEFRQRALMLFFAGSLAPALSCADDGEPEKGPTEEEMRQAASEACEQGLECGTIPGSVTLEECIANQLGAYQAAPECLAVYHLDECLATQTCEELDRLDQLHMGDCADEREEAGGLTALCVAP